ncbi:hypothetical protein BD410DRAFT_789081 [Rickenella mellea]|uniref:F-box domain-containing protein n=1 Tax=Rickenella mellea TaxID=50990 RepID=A0A4Y7Q3V1_9AGAM|nr:hypothetical protein BD410DRAFT_789081 [Rickenella mellea]
MAGKTSPGNNQKLSTSAQHLIPDVLAEIFLQCNLNEARFPRPTIRGSPLILGRVCHSWRQEWLTRSASLPLSFLLFDERVGDILYRIDALGGLLAHTHRWKHVEVYGEVKLLSFFLRALELGAPLLETLDINGHSDEWADEGDSPNCVEIDLSRSPKLASVHLPESVMVTLHHQNVILHKLRSIRLGSIRVDGPGIMSMDDYLSLLALCGIIECKISNLSLWMPRETPIAGMDFGPFFDHLCLPDLEELHIDAMGEVTPPIGNFPWTHIRSLLRRSRASLVNLDISADSPENARSDEDVLGVLHLSPDIRYIFLYGVHISVAVLQALAHPTGHEGTANCLCPKLVNISVIDGKFSHGETAVKDMILSRHIHNKPFQRVRLDDCGLDHSILDEDEEIQKFVARGLRLDIG